MDHCLEESVLKAYASGHVSDTAAAKIERHLDQCGHCLEKADRLRSESDSLLLALQNLREDDSPDADPKLAPVLASISDLRELSRSGKFHLSSNSHDAVLSVRDYLLLRKLGEGGMGTVFLALHTRLDKHVALKILRCDRKDNLEAISRFEREMRLVGKLEHRNIVRALDAGEEDGTHFLAMEYIDGVDLRNLVRSLRRLEIADACELIRQAAVGLQHAHENSMIHRDVKPSNLMLSPEGQVKVLDLGLAQFWRPFSHRTSLTATKQVLGTFAYMSPEQCTAGGDVDIRTDVFSLGVSFYELLAGRLPLKPGELAAALPDIRRHRNDLPEELRQVLNAMLERTIDDRLDCMATVAHGVEPWTYGANLKSLLEKFHDQESASSVEAAPQISGRSMSGQVSQVNTQSWGSTAREQPPPVPPPRQDQDTSKQTPLVPREEPPVAVPFWKQPLVAALAGSAFALCLALVAILGPCRENEAPRRASPIRTPAPESGTLDVRSQLDVVRDMLQEGYPYLEVSPIETNDRIRLGLDAQELPVGEYRPSIQPWYLEVVDSMTKLKVGNNGKLQVGGDAPLVLNVSVNLDDFAFHYPPIPEKLGASVTYSGTIGRSGIGEAEMTYKLRLLVMGVEAVTKCQWLKVEVTATNAPEEYTETAYLLVNAKKYNEKQELDIVRGWLLANSPTISQSLRARGIDTTSGLVVPFPVDEPDQDPIGKAADRLGPPLLPVERRSVQDVLVLLFKARFSAASPLARTLRASLPQKVEFDRQKLMRVTPPLDCFIVGSQKRTPHSDGGQERVYELWLHPNVPFRFVHFELNSSVRVRLTHDRHDPGDPDVPETPPDDLAAHAKLIDNLPVDPPWDVAWLKNTKEGEWVRYDVLVSGLKDPVEVTVRVGGAVEASPGGRCRWIEVDINSPKGIFRQTAILLVNEDAYPNEFEVVRGWIQHKGWTFEFGSNGDDTATVEDLCRLGHLPGAAPLNMFDALERTTRQAASEFSFRRHRRNDENRRW